MSKIIIGIDPDSKAHGVAVYVNSKLEILRCCNLEEILCLINMQPNPMIDQDIEFHIEDVNAVSAAFSARDRKTNINVKLKMAQHIGMCKQSQIELERFLSHYNIKIVNHKISKMWKKDKSQFESVTGWKGRSNEDTRSAAYFGFLGLGSIKRLEN
ncbi:MAG: hypothetical protein Unbinned5350contig1004_9 [Prokaryotic dsDNA virus sp.]|nr:MAG: hypothetical protein Unbinned5350contig1004_9 [Prokaryotic dsDNA virus sp.]|tara:strand:- start:25451 stop:25918 length:468 start_codon:yes stop_codon:yes gene_type:complete